MRWLGQIRHGTGCGNDLCALPTPAGSDRTTGTTRGRGRLTRSFSSSAGMIMSRRMGFPYGWPASSVPLRPENLAINANVLRRRCPARIHDAKREVSGPSAECEETCGDYVGATGLTPLARHDFMALHSYRPEPGYPASTHVEYPQRHRCRMAGVLRSQWWAQAFDPNRRSPCPPENTMTALPDRERMTVPLAVMGYAALYPHGASTDAWA